MSALPNLSGWAIEALVASALLMALVLLVRTPVRKAFGPRVSYALWLLPALRLVLPSLPAGWHQAVADTPISRVGETLTVVILPSVAGAAPVEAVSSSPSLATILLVAWAIVAAGFLIFHLAHHLTFCRRVLRSSVTVDRIDRVRVVESDMAAGPMAFGILHPTVAFPSDFAERFDADERALALAHELGHHQRGDLVANWIALAVLALHWFNPLAWRAFRMFRADQELANDARVLTGRSPYERHAYACAIVKAAHGKAVGAACHLHSVKDLKGRLKMLRTQISPRRLAVGVAAVGTFSLAALTLTASGTSAAERIRTKVADATGIALPAPETPETPETPVVPLAPLTPTARQVHRVVVIKDGTTTTTYEGEDARRFMAAHPAPPPPPAVPATPPSPEAPTPPTPPRPVVYMSGDGHMRVDMTVPRVGSAKCGDAGNAEVVRRTGRDGDMTICTDRIAQMAATAQREAAVAQRQAAYASAQASRYAVSAGQVRLDAMRHALEGLRQTQASFMANRAMPAEARQDAIESLEESIRDLERDMAQRDD
jgi:bla regulator protein BlaR1